MNRRYLTLAAGAALLLSTGCAKFTEPFRDAPRGSTNSAPADVLTFPDGFSNAATKCDHGNRVYVLYHGDAALGAMAVAPNDPTCR